MLGPSRQGEEKEMSILTLRDVSRRYGRTEALRGVSLDLHGGGVYGLLGRNGAGKTTLLRMIPCLLHPSEGEVRVFELDPWDQQEEVKQRLGYVADHDEYPPLLRVRDLLGVHAVCYEKWDEGMASRLLDQFSLDRRRRLHTLSKGQKRQVSLLCAVCHQPELLVMDEPAGGLDPVVRREFLEVTLDCLSEEGSTVIFSSQQFADVERIADHVILLHEGKVLADEPLATLQENATRIAVEVQEEESGGAREKLQTIPECLKVKKISGALVATLRMRPADAEERVREQGFRVVESGGLGLEELFIEWTGGNS